MAHSSELCGCRCNIRIHSPLPLIKGSLHSASPMGLGHCGHCLLGTDDKVYIALLKPTSFPSSFSFILTINSLQPVAHPSKTSTPSCPLPSITVCRPSAPLIPKSQDYPRQPPFFKIRHHRNHLFVYQNIKMLSTT